MTTASVGPTGPSPGAAGAPGKARTSGLAIASLVAGLLGLCTAGLGSLAGLICGMAALKKIGRSGGALRGRGLAIAGLIASVCTLLLWVLAAGIGGGVYSYYRSLESSEEEPPAAPATAAPAELAPDLGGGVTMKMVLIRPGKFMMGDGKDRHEVTLSRPFYLGVTEVTQTQYEAVMGTNPSHFKGATHPVEMVYWNEAAEFCNKLSEKTRRTFRLPTEAEWEYACRAGTETAFSFGDDPSALGEYAWWGRNSAETTHPVGRNKPNAWGLYDMHGNVWEWCADWYDAYPKGPVTNPSGPAAGRYHVLRGGSWSYVDADCFQCAFRLYYDPAPSLRNFNYGFRCAGNP